MRFFKKNTKNGDQSEINEKELKELEHQNSELNKHSNVNTKQYQKLIMKFMMILCSFVVFGILFLMSINGLTKNFNFLAGDDHLKKNTKDKSYEEEIANLKKNSVNSEEVVNPINPVAEDIANLINGDSKEIKVSAPPVEIVQEKPKPKPNQAYLDRITPDSNDDNHHQSYSVSEAIQPNLNSDYLLSENTVIKCNLMNDVNSTIESQTKCLILKDVHSDNGQNILIPKGSIASGKSEEGIIEGQNKMFITWQKIKTPNGTIIPLNSSPSVDKMGASGHQAKIKSNFLLRFGNALMISMLETAVGTGFDMIKDKKTNIEIGQAQSNAEMGIETLRKSIDIDSVGIIKRGTIINILIKKDIDFSEVI